MKVGDRVRYHKRHRSLGRKELNGREGTVIALRHDRRLKVKWDDGGLDADAPFIENVELIMPNTNTIDTTKTLQVPDWDKEVTFVTETSDGHILVDVASFGWAVFNKQGEFVRAKKNYVYPRGLANKVERKVRYRGIFKSGEISTIEQGGLEDIWTRRGNPFKQALKITSENERVVEVEVINR